MRRYRLSLIAYLLFVFLLPAAAFGQDEQLPQFRKPQPRVILPGLDFGEITRDGDYIYVPFLGEYIAAVYSFAVAAASIIAAIVIVFSGFQWTASGGSQDAIGAAKKRIVGAVTGLILAVGSYTILYAVNPELVQFRSLRVKFVQTQNLNEYLTEAEGLENPVDFAAYPTIPTRPLWTHETFNCAKPGTPTGVVDPRSLRTNTCPVGVFGKFTVIPEMIPALCRVGEILNAQGFGIRITDSYRTFSEQVTLWCGKGAVQYEDTKQRKKFFGVPGFSPHGSGIGVDAHLTDKNGKPLYKGVTGKNQCGVKPEYIKTLANGFYQADPKFYRYKKEIWHFEYIANGNPTDRLERSSVETPNPLAEKCPVSI